MIIGGRTVRPLWQMPFALLRWLAQAYVDWSNDWL